MNDNRGFTLIEMIVGGAVLLIVLMIATSFFLFQSQHGGQLMKETGVRETISSALTMIKRDIMQAGSGLYEQLELSIWVDGLFSGGSDYCYRKLYVSYGDYLSSRTASANSDYTTNTNTYSVYGTKKNKNCAIFTGEEAAQTAFTIAAMPDDIWGVLTSTGGTNPVVAFLKYKDKPADDTPATNTYTPKHRFTIDSTRVLFTPTIFYQLIDQNTTLSATELEMQDKSLPELRRNGVIIAGGTGDRTMKFLEKTDTDPGGFRIRCQFKDDTWVPSSSAQFNAQTFKNLRMVEVQLRYRIKKSKMGRLEAEGAPAQTNKEEGWSQIITKTISVSPREVVLANY